MEARSTHAPAALAAILDEVPALVAVMRGDALEIEYANARLRALVHGAAPVGRPAADVLRELMDPPSAAAYATAMRQVHETGQPAVVGAAPVRFAGAVALSYFDLSALPLPDRGGVVLHAIDVTDIVEARRRVDVAESRYTRLVESNVVGVTVTRGGAVVEANEPFRRLVGRDAAEIEAGLPWRELLSPARFETERAHDREIHATGVAVPHEMQLLRPDGTTVTALMTAAALPDDAVLGVFFDVTAGKAAERAASEALARETSARAAAEQATARIARLQEATSALASTSTSGDVARTLVRHGLEAAEASAGVLVRGATQAKMQVLHAVGMPVGRVDLWRDFPATMPSALMFALRTRDAVELADPSAVAAACPELAGDDIGTGAALALPLLADGRVLGALLLTFRSPGLPDAETLALLDTLMGLGAAALDRAQLYEDRVYVADRLQQGLLPQQLPELPGLDVAVSYRSIAGGGEVGGDFYDLFPSGEGRWTVAVGDVCGKGTEAAVVTGLARHTVRAAAQLLGGPADTLSFLNDALRMGVKRPPFCTVAVADLERDGGDWRARVSSGGHPFPLVLRRGGRIEEVELTGTMLGVDADPRLGEADVRLGPGDALVLYTDGVTDARAEGGERFGEERLHRTLLLGAGGGAGGIVAAVDGAVRDHHRGPAADDRAVIVLLVT